VAGQQVRTFTVSFPGHGAFDEGPFARTVARHLKTDHHELQGEPGSVDLLPRLARQFDEPLADSSMIPTYLVARAVREHAGVALGGDGGDELFGGYGHYRWLLQQQRALRFIPMAARQLASAAARALPIGARGRNHLIALDGDLATRVAHVNLYFDARSRARLLAPLGPRATSFRAEQVKEAVCASSDPVHAASTVDFLTDLADDLLVKVDRAAMLTSLEVRAPLLDHRVVEFAFARVPDHLKVNPTGTKVLLRQLAGRLLPREIAEKPKQGFSLPLASWFTGPFGAFIAEVIDGASPHIFDRSVIRAVQNSQQHGRNNTQRLFALAMFELWRRTYDIKEAA
jgi:asparagine synthase (glutamine-hydrolysing)